MRSDKSGNKSTNTIPQFTSRSVLFINKARVWSPNSTYLVGVWYVNMVVT